MTLEYRTHQQGPQSDTYTDGTRLLGYIKATYDDLVAAFGPPTTGDEYKIDWYWIVVYGRGTTITIYNWKNGPNYLGKEGLTKDQIDEWHVGGHHPVVLSHLERTLNTPIETHETRSARWSEIYK